MNCKGGTGKLKSKEKKKRQPIVWLKLKEDSGLEDKVENLDR
jgi:hypothetical protein